MDTNSALTDTLPQNEFILKKINVHWLATKMNQSSKRIRAKRYQSWLENERAQAPEAVSQWQTVADFRHTPWETALTVSFEKPNNWNGARRKDKLLKNYYIPVIFHTANTKEVVIQNSNWTNSCPLDKLFAFCPGQTTSKIRQSYMYQDLTRQKHLRKS